MRALRIAWDWIRRLGRRVVKATLSFVAWVASHPSQVAQWLIISAFVTVGWTTFGPFHLYVTSRMWLTRLIYPLLGFQPAVELLPIPGTFQRIYGMP